MGIRDYLKPWVDPYDTLGGWKVGMIGMVVREMNFGFIVPVGSIVVISAIPEAMHGADRYALSSFTFGEEKYCECALSEESGDHHFGEGATVVAPPEHHIWCNRFNGPTRECEMCKGLWAKFPYTNEDRGNLMKGNFPENVERT